ncbi:hypothetical protein GYMLUDRAFT_162908, partial [Collybiopsis luxurians FD-317 M1]
KAISSLAKRPSDVTRQGTQKLKFVPTLPARRRYEPVAESILPSTPSNDRGRGRGPADGKGKGRGVPKASVEMVASGPFALGPAMAATSSRRVAQASTPIPTPTKAGTSSLGAGLSQTAVPKIKTEERRSKLENEGKEEEEVYSDPDEGVEIIDMENVRQMDWMAPDSLRKEKAVKLKNEEPDAETGALHFVKPAIAMDLGKNEDVKDLETLMDDLGRLPEDSSDDSRRLYFFQFPSPFPTFTSSSTGNDAMQIDPPTTPGTKRVTFAANVKNESDMQQSTSSLSISDSSETKKELDGLIGHLEVYRSGARKIRLANGIVLDVTAATQASFLEHAVHLDLNENKLAVLGEIYKRYVVSPDVDVLLGAMDAQDNDNQLLEGEENLIRMDVT